MKAVVNCLTYALIAMAWINGDSKYKSYSNDRGFRKPVEDLLETSGVD